MPRHLTLCPPPGPDGSLASSLDGLRRQLADHLTSCLPCYREYRGGPLSRCDRAFLIATEITAATCAGLR